jgi:CheY-like chemotaxis protein
MLAVDDEEANLLLLRRVLERAGHPSVSTATDPTQMPALFLETHPCLVPPAGSGVA